MSTFLINGRPVPVPIYTLPKKGTIVFSLHLGENFGFPFNPGNYQHIRMLNAGWLHSTYEAAQQHLNALLSFTALSPALLHKT